MNFKSLAKLTFFLPPELLHNLFIQSLKLNLYKKKKVFENLKITVLGKDFDNPLGLAAGFDKNAEVIDGSLNLGFGFVEVGTVTPMPQKGNLKPRVFKIPEYEAVIQRLGFNNAGVESFIENLNKREKEKKGIIGINIGKNKNSTNPFDDYELLYKLLQPFADYITINISWPNTPGLRDLQKKTNLNNMLKKISKKKKRPTKIK